MANDEKGAETDGHRAGARASEPREGEFIDVITTGKRETNDEAGIRVESSIRAALIARPGLVENLVDVVAAGLRAEKVHYDLVTKAWKAEPDYKERREMAKLALAYIEGLPAQTVLNLNANANAGPKRLSEVLKGVPNARRAVERFIDSMPVPVHQPRKSEASQSQ